MQRQILGDMVSRMNVNAKGSIGLIKVVDDLYTKGYHCFLPFDDYCAVDLIALGSGGAPLRLQVKYRKKAERKGVAQNYYTLKLASSVNGKWIPIDRTKIDGWAVYLVDDDRVEYIPVDDLDGQSCKNIRSEMRWDWIK